VTKGFARWKYRNAQHWNINSLHTRQNTYYLVSRILIARNLISHNLTSRDPNLPAVLWLISTFNETEIKVWFLCIRFRQKSIERAMDLTDSFTWEDLPTRDADTGHLTAAGWIPLTMKYTRRAANVTLCFHSVQSTIRIIINHETQYNAWYPFDWTVTPFYELVNVSQVTLSKTESTLSILVVLSI